MAFGDSIKFGNIQENWLFKFANDDSGYLYFSFADVTYAGNFYRGVVLNKPTIRESIDLAKGTSKAGNLSITIPDFTYLGAPISEELYGGSGRYINQVVTIHSQADPISDYLWEDETGVWGNATWDWEDTADYTAQIGTYRLTDMSSNGSEITLSLTAHRPWDYISIPLDKSSTGVYEPIAYGNFTKNPHGAIDPNASFLTSKDLFPLPNMKQGKNSYVYFIYPQSYVSDAEPHFYDRFLDEFIPFDGTDTATASFNSSDTVGVPIHMERGSFVQRPLTATGSAEWTNPDNAINANTDDFSTAEVVAEMGGTNPDSSSITFDIPSVDGELTEFKIYVRATLKVYEEGGAPNGTGFIYLRLYGTDNNILQNSSHNTTSATGSSTVNGVADYDNHDCMIAYGSTKTIPDTFDIKVHTSMASGSGGDTITTTIKVYDVIVQMKLKNDTASEPTASHEKAASLDFAYAGVDGLANSWDSSPITLIHEAHRDMLIRYAGVTTDTPDGWSTLDTNKDWGIRWWATKPAKLEDTLNKLAYEGGFIFRWKNDGSPQYIHLPDGAITPSYTLTKNDISDIKLGPTALSELQTHMDINYDKHPAENRYITSVSSSDSTQRTNWNIAAKENKQQINLDAYVSPTVPTTSSSNPNDDFYSYYSAIFGSIGFTVSGTIINPAFYAMEVGDFIDFSNTDMWPVKPFGYNLLNNPSVAGAWVGLDFIVTSLTRTPGQLKFEARKI